MSEEGSMTTPGNATAVRLAREFGFNERGPLANDIRGIVDAWQNKVIAAKAALDAARAALATREADLRGAVALLTEWDGRYPREYGGDDTLTPRTASLLTGLRALLSPTGGSEGGTGP